MSEQNSSEIENTKQEQEQETIDSGVDGVPADDLYKNTPVFDVNSKEFFGNMRKDRNRMRFSNGSKISSYMQGTKYRKPFYMRYIDKSGQSFLSKVK